MSRSKRRGTRGTGSEVSAEGDAVDSQGAMPILSEAELEVAARAVESLLGDVTAPGTGGGAVVREILRLQALSSRCQAERESRGWSIKEVAARLRCAQYRLRAVESSLLQELDPRVLEAYVSELGLDDFFEEWARANPDLASKVRVAKGGTSRKSGGRGASSRSRVCRIKVQLQHVAPPVWRTIEVPASYSFWDLHVAIQDAMGWLDYHLHLFEPADFRFGIDSRVGIPDPDAFEGDPIFEAGWAVPMDRWLKHPGDTVVYIYDFGDDWHHEVTLEEVVARAPRTRYPRCVDGAGACPPEDCGGPPGYQQLLTVLADRNDPEHESMLEWLGGHHDPAAFDPRKLHFDDPQMRWKVAFEGGAP